MHPRNETTEATETTDQYGWPAEPRHEGPDYQRGPDAEGPPRRRWRDVQAGFVDDPRDSVRRAGELVGEAVQVVTVRLTEHWQAIGPDRGDAATEELRRALRRHRALFDRLVDL